MPVSIRIAAAALVIAALYPSHAAVAFGLRLGPFHFSLPGPRYHHRYRGTIVRSQPPARLAHTESGDVTAASAAEPTDGGPPSLLYPVLGWPSLQEDIFWPRTTDSWAFGYDNIFSQTFAKYSAQRAATFCPHGISMDDIAIRISRQTTPTTAQKPLLRQLATALGQADHYLIKSCPAEIPAQPVARLQLMDSQIDAMIMALDIVRPRLQAFEQSLDDKQRARVDGSLPFAATSRVPACKLNATSVDGSLSQLEQVVQPTDVQRPALAKMADAFKRAAAELDASCTGTTPPTALLRLEVIETRLDATWRAVLTIQVALANFQKELSGEQVGRLNALEVAVTH
jgi:hypothetical protein